MPIGLGLGPVEQHDYLAGRNVAKFEEAGAIGYGAVTGISDPISGRRRRLPRPRGVDHDRKGAPGAALRSASTSTSPPRAAPPCALTTHSASSSSRMRDQATISPGPCTAKPAAERAISAQVLAAVAQHRASAAQRPPAPRCGGRPGCARVEAVAAGGAERPEAGQRRRRAPPVDGPAAPGARAGAPGRTSPRAGSGRPSRSSRAASCARPASGPAKRLLGAVVDARDAEREELQRDAGDDLVVGRRRPLEKRTFSPKTWSWSSRIETCRLPRLRCEPMIGVARRRSRRSSRRVRRAPWRRRVSVGRISPMSSAALRLRSSTSR